jgi:hypothetical protein
MRYQQIVDALAEAGMEDAVNVIDRLYAANRKPPGIRRFNGSRSTQSAKEEVLHLHRTTSLSQAQIAGRVNINQGQVSRILNGRV